MSTRTKYTVWIKCRRSDEGYELEPNERIWEVSENGCTIKQAERIAREVRQDFGIPTRILPDGAEAPI